MPLSGGTSCFKTVRIGLWGEAPLCQGAVYEFQKKRFHARRVNTVLLINITPLVYDHTPDWWLGVSLHLLSG